MIEDKPRFMVDGTPSEWHTLGLKEASEDSTYGPKSPLNAIFKAEAVGRQRAYAQYIRAYRWVKCVVRREQVPPLLAWFGPA